MGLPIFRADTILDLSALKADYTVWEIVDFADKMF